MDVAMSGVAIEEHVILSVEHIELIYSQSITLYDIIHKTSQPSIDSKLSKTRPHFDGVIFFYLY